MLKRIKNFLHIRTQKVEKSVYNKIDDLFESLNEDIVTVYLGADLVKYGELTCTIIGELREEVKDECGFIIPPVRIKENDAIQENQYNVLIRDKKVGQIYVIPTEEGIRSEFYDVMKSIIYEHLDEIFTNEIAEKYINTVQKNNGWLIWNITNVLSIVDIKTILADIISKGKSINNINYIFEKMGEYILSDGICQSAGKKFNPHMISQAISKYLYK